MSDNVVVHPAWSTKYFCDGAMVHSVFPKFYAKHREQIDADAATRGYAMLMTKAGDAPLALGGKYWFLLRADDGDSE